MIKLNKPLLLSTLVLFLSSVYAEETTAKLAVTHQPTVPLAEPIPEYVSEETGPIPTNQYVQHPYYPKTLELPNYKPSVLSTPVMFSIFGSVVFLVIMYAFYLIAKTNLHRLHAQQTLLTKLEKFGIIWFAISGMIHMVLEGYFVAFNRSIAGNSHVLADIWREYALSDSRYLSSDPFTVVMEGITALFDGPLALFTVYAIVNRHPLRHVTQILCSMCQLYGDVLYMLINILERCVYTHPDPFYFWAYFVFCNLPWIVIPMVYIYDSSVAIYRASKLYTSLYETPKAKKS
ncbi:3-beta-hydroxysteroid-Delta(8),Delta(7)-isomerase [Zancudomyces culisetae]|uniref:3-beta-hydroxysteroid-Delta(8), Delta(7)-isomerase n=1 Tax=Zancudomyces culisetae TaxID=1213189 RepID=A0A1R1PXV1_ZANCU|nr:3-beta-hydroxysteroid-Delta(8),Delta(7)-isomerase [Zancudomyces culisetae]|eukprot:OMH85804.1 3-beta-hydroxysteroid-Delta(8),Delta(7)-isomerase [Zancudomyces culisetae]